MRAPGCGRLVLPLLLLAAAALAEGDAKGLKEGETPGNFMEDEQWLSSISQYSGKIKHWNRFRDVSLHGREGQGRGFGEEGTEWSPRRRHVAATGSAAQPADRTESKQRAPTRSRQPSPAQLGAPSPRPPRPGTPSPTASPGESRARSCSGGARSRHRLHCRSGAERGAGDKMGAGREGWGPWLRLNP